ncbi:hypothetical protein NP493_117g07037, partial [Ridgeia piscesae]
RSLQVRHCVYGLHTDVAVLRQEHRIVGRLVGCLPRLPRQNIQLGRPLQLLAEEATLLVDKGVAQVALCREKKREEIQAHADEIQRGRMAKRQRLVKDQIDADEAESTATCRHTELEPAEWLYPVTETETTRYRVFKDLWEKGYYLTSGCKFGGEPARFHSFYIAVCRPSSQSFTPLDLITLGRLGANVKKTVILCTVDEDTDQMCYISLQWTGLS